MIYWLVRFYYRNHNIVELISNVNSKMASLYAESFVYGLTGFPGVNKFYRTINMVKFTFKYQKYNYLIFNLPFIFPEEYLIWKLAQ